MIVTPGRNISLVLQTALFPLSGVKSAVRLQAKPSEWCWILPSATLRKLLCSY